MMHKVLHSSTHHDWETPPEVFDPINAEFRFTLDPCASKETAKCARFFTPEDDGLVQDWGTETCFVNPPYGTQIKHWVKKAWEASRGGATVVMLIPARTDTAYWHEYVMRGEVRFVRGRIYFLRNGERGRAPFPSTIVVFKAVV